MEMMIERRADADGRIPLQVPVALEPHPVMRPESGGAGLFEAEAINLGTGGLSLRGRHVPDVGEQLVCHFDVPPGEVPMEVQGEVVWAHRVGGGFGHFGLRFVALPEERVALLSELLAEQTVRYASMGGRAYDQEHDQDSVGPTGEFEAVEVEHGAESLAAPEQFEPPQAADDQATYNPWADPGAALGSGHSEGADVTRPVAAGGEAELQLGVGASLHGELAAADRTGAMFMQTLDMLALGDATHLTCSDGRARSGAIADVRLVVYEGIPRLMIELAFDGEDGASVTHGHATVEVPRGPAAEVEHGDGDTVPDLAPPGQQPTQAPGETPHDRVVRARRTTLSEFEAEDGAAGEPGVDAADSASRFDEASFIDGFYSEAAGELAPDAHAEPQPGRGPSQVGVSGAAATAEVSRSDDDARALRLPVDGAVGPATEHGPGRHSREPDEEPGVEGPLRLPAIAGAAGRLTERATGMAARGVRSVTASLTMQLRTAKRAARQLARPAPRRTTGGRRRSTAGSVARHGGQSERGASLVIAGLAVGALALGAYAVWPASDDGQLGQPGATLQAPPVAAAPAAAAPVVVPGTARPAVGTAPGGAAAGTSAAGAVASVPRPASVPAGSPYAVDVHAPAQPASAAADPGPAFGAEHVPGARRFALRMTEKVNELRGVVDDGGFRVIIPGSHSLDRAGPIAASHGAIHRSMILNKDGRSELTIRFADGRSPAYRVVGKGATLELLVAEK